MTNRAPHLPLIPSSAELPGRAFASVATLCSIPVRWFTSPIFDSPNPAIMASADWPSLLRYAPRIMHNIVVESIRRRNAQVHGGGAVHVELDTGVASVKHAGSEGITAVGRALEELESVDARLARVVEMRFFDGMTEPEIARALGVTERTVRRDWQKARLLLAHALHC